MFAPLLATLALVQAQLPDAGALLRSFNDVRREAYAKSRAEGDASAAVIKEKALAALTGLDATKIPEAQADSWAELFHLAGKEDEATTLSEKAVTYHAMQAWSHQQRLLSTYIQRDDKPKILETLAYAIGTSVPMLGQLGEPIVFSLTNKYAESDPLFLLQAYDTLLRRFDLKRPMSSSELGWTRFAVARLSANRDAVLYRMGRKAEATADLKRVRTLVKGDERAETAIAEVENRLSLVDVKPAPEIVSERSIGAYTSLAALKGKVVVLDFFAHWCGPCKRAFPDMRQMYAQDKAKGLEIVGVTSIQGYYEDKQNLAPDVEFALMRDRFVPEFKLPWPVAFEKGKAASKAYGVSGIPHLVVVDRKGLVRRIVVGYTPEEFKQTRAFVEKLLTEK